MNDLLTQEEANNLPIGTKVIITWSGGNGPIEYEITGKFWGHSIAGESLKNCTLDFVGKEKYHTHVRIVEKNHE